MHCFRNIILIVFILLGLCAPSFAGGPFTVDQVTDSGTAQRWLYDKLLWYSDSSDLANAVDHDQAVALVQEAINKWLNAKLEDQNTTVITAEYGGDIGVDINKDNMWDYINYEEGPTVVIFDRDGSITEELFPGNSDEYLGLTQLLVSSSSGKRLLKGVVILNGLILDNGTVSVDQYKAPILHEIGHLLNLDHTQINMDIAENCVLGDECNGGHHIPTMFPQLKTDRQDSLNIDDIVTISWIYPQGALTQSFCTVVGHVQDGNGAPLQGVNVIARRVNDGTSNTRSDARSMVSGVMYPGCSEKNDGSYYLFGLVPGKTYEVYYEPLGGEFTGASDFEPLPNPPTGFESGIINATDGASTITCSTAGQIIEMPFVKIAVTNPCPNATPGTGSDNGAQDQTTPGAGGGCSLIVQ
ncbi:MAG: hypothetical protein ABH859_01900 [Pseudomonadota bacterium]